MWVFFSFIAFENLRIVGFFGRTSDLFTKILRWAALVWSVEKTPCDLMRIWFPKVFWFCFEMVYYLYSLNVSRNGTAKGKIMLSQEINKMLWWSVTWQILQNWGGKENWRCIPLPPLPPPNPPPPPHPSRPPPRPPLSIWFCGTAFLASTFFPFIVCVLKAAGRKTTH